MYLGPALWFQLQAPCTFDFIVSRVDIISLHGLRDISSCELSKAFFYLLSHFHWKASVYSWDGWVGAGGGDCRSFAFSTHCLVNEPESGYCRLSSSGLDSAVPCLIDIPSLPSQPKPPTPHSTFSFITKHWLACQWPRPDLMNTHLMLAHLSVSAPIIHQRSKRGELRI